MIIDPVLIITISYCCKVFNFWTTISSYIYNKRGGKACRSSGAEIKQRPGDVPRTAASFMLN